MRSRTGKKLGIMVIHWPGCEFGKQSTLIQVAMLVIWPDEHAAGEARTHHGRPGLGEDAPQ